MKHTEESLMALAMEFAQVQRRLCIGRAEVFDSNQALEALRLAIREVLAERDELKHRLEHENAESMRVYNEMGLRIDLERAEAECERLRNDLSVHKRLLDDKLADCISWINENERLRKDAERLDYIEKHARCDPKMDGHHVWWPTTFKNALRGCTLREAIDAAMKEQP